MTPVPAGIAGLSTASIGDHRIRPDEVDAGEYAGVPGFCRSATLEEIKKYGSVLTPGR